MERLRESVGLLLEKGLDNAIFVLCAIEKPLSELLVEYGNVESVGRNLQAMLMSLKVNV